jgi:hypothetical protein
MFQQLLSRVLEANGANGANGISDPDGVSDPNDSNNGLPTDFYKVLIGLSLVAKGKGSPLYDPVALLAALNIISVNAAPHPVTVEEAQRMLDSCPEGIPSPATNAALVISTDVALNSTDGTSDTDDRVMLLLLCFFLAKRQPNGAEGANGANGANGSEAASGSEAAEGANGANSSEGVHSVTIVLSARKKGPKSAKDATTPDHVVQWMKARIAQFGAHAALAALAAHAAPAADSDDSASGSFSVNGVEVRVFQQQAQTTLSPPTEGNEDFGQLAQLPQIAELRAANASLYEWLDRSAGPKDPKGPKGSAGPLIFVGCGPIDVAFALYLGERGASGYTISFDGGVNAGAEEDLESMRHSHRGGPVLLSRSSQVINIGPAITRGLVTPPGIVVLDDASGVKAIAENAFKVAGSPLVTGNLAFRIFVSNCTSFLGSMSELVARARAISCGPVPTVFQYSRSLALTMVANLLASHAAPIDRSVLSSCIASGYHLPALAVPLPPALTRTIDANVKGLDTVAALYAFVALGMDARLCSIMAEWHSIVAPLAPLAATAHPTVSFAVPVFSESGTLLLSQPF